MTRRSSNYHLWFEVVIIEVDGDILCFLFVEIVCAMMQPRHLENINSHINRVSSYVFKRPYGWEEVPMFNARMNQAGTLHIENKECNS